MKTTSFFKKSISSLILFLFYHLSVAQTLELWGTTSLGGNSNSGTIFKTDGNGSNYSLQKNLSFNDGNVPLYGKFCQAANGKLYGTTRSGGYYNSGVIYELDPVNSNYSKKWEFQDDSTGKTGFSGLVEYENGKLYGITNEGGVNNLGVLFELNPETGVYAKKFDFDGANSGSRPGGALLEASNGKLYGTTRFGGTNNAGVLFEYNPETDTYSKKLDFDELNNGSVPLGALIEVEDEKLYGMTQNGGINGFGVLFEFDITNDSCITRINFNGAGNGKFPTGILTQAFNGKLYGMTSYGGESDQGVFFEYNLETNTYLKKLDFDGANNGGRPKGGLLSASNNKLYGLTSEGGSSDFGVLFEYDLETNSYTKKNDFDGANGAKPFGTLLEVISSQTNISESILSQSLTLFPNPTKGDISIDLGSKYNSIETIVRDDAGKEVLRQADKNTSTLKLNLEGKSGVYLIEVKSDNGEQAVLRVLKL